MKLENISILGKIAAAFGMLLLLMVTLGTTAILRMSVMNDAATDMRDNWLPSTAAMGGADFSCRELSDCGDQRDR
jgi:methyl-accepting chemotaxis protein